MIELSLMNVMIFLSVSICVVVCFYAAFIILRRDPKSHEHKTYALFFIGLGGFVLFYIFLQDPVLKDFSYPLQLATLSTAEIGLFFFYYALTHDGVVSKKLFVLITGVLYTIPISCVILHPYTFILEWYGYELAVDFWYIITVSTIYGIVGFIPLAGMFWILFTTKNPDRKRRMELIFGGLLVMSISGVFTLTVIPVVYNIHYAKPLGYLAFIVGVLIMTYAFRRRTKKLQVNLNNAE